MSFNVDTFRTVMQWDGARPNLFEVYLTFPNYVQLGSLAGQQSRFMCKASSLPGSTINPVPVPYFGREVKVAGNRTFQDWTVNIINDEDFVIRNAFEQWHRGINENVANIRSRGAISTSPLFPGSSYAIDAEVYQYAKMGGAPIKGYRFVGMWPNDIASIELDWGSNDTIEEFSVTLSYQYWTTLDTVASNPIVSSVL